MFIKSVLSYFVRIKLNVIININFSLRKINKKG